MTLTKIPLLVVALALAACSRSNGGALDEAKVAFIQSFGGATMEPTFAGVRADANGLEAAIGDLALGVDQTRLDTARSAWRTAHASWARSEVLLFDRLDDLFFIFRVDEIDIDPVAIEASIAGSDTLDVNYIAVHGTGFKGYHALEYLLFGEGPGAQASLAALAGSTRRVEYLVATAGELVQQQISLRDVAATMSSDMSSETGKPARDTLDKVVNQLFNRVELLADQELGRTLGMTIGGVPQAPGEESAYAMTSLAEVRSAIEGVRLLWRGPAGDTGLAKMLAIREPDSLDHIEVKIRALEYALAEVQDPALGAMGSELESMNRAFEKAKELGQTLRVVLPRGLLVTGFSRPFDGD